VKVSETTFSTIDTETTGTDPTKDRIVEFALRDSYGYGIDFLVNPGMPIPYETSAIHHLTDVDVADALPYEEAMMRIERIAMPSYVIVAHNAPFDRSFLPCIDDRRWLCSRRLAQHLFPELSSHSNQFLRYAFVGSKLDLKGLSPHRAAADVIVTQFILERLIAKYFADGRADDIDTLLAYADSPIRLQAMPFGKHRGPMKDVPSDYLVWSLRNMQDIDADLRFSLEAELSDRRNRR
jgi:exodeoxyribonuclease X